MVGDRKRYMRTLFGEEKLDQRGEVQTKAETMTCGWRYFN